MTAPKRARLALVVTLSFLSVALAGCMSSDGPADGSDPAPPKVLTDEEAYASFEQAMARLDAPDTNTRRFSMEARAEAVNASDEEHVRMDFLMDLDKALGIMSIEQKGLDDSDLGVEGVLVVGQVWKTVFFGPTSSLTGIYNESETPIERYEDFDSSPMGNDEEDDDSFGGPQDFLANAQNLSQDGVTSTRAIEYEGRPAVELTFVVEDGSSTGHARAIVWLEPALPAFMELTRKDPTAESAIERDGVITLKFRYGDDARNEHEEGLVRLESMTLLGTDDMQSAFGSGSDDEKRYTIKPSRAGGVVPLSEVEARVLDGDDGDKPVLVLRLEEGSAENADVRVTFEDEDGDGKVSPGDVLVLVEKTDAASEYSVGLYDEETGLFLAPGAGVLAAFVGLGAAVLIVGRRSR